jgi:hypothetical protein
MELMILLLSTQKWVTAIASVLDKERLKVYGPGHWKIVVTAARSLIAADVTGIHHMTSSSIHQFIFPI